MGYPNVAGMERVCFPQYSLEYAKDIIRLHKLKLEENKKKREVKVSYIYFEGES